VIRGGRKEVRETGRRERERKGDSTEEREMEGEG
jgi:hypothetical protein